MPDIVYRSIVSVKRVDGPVREAMLPSRDSPVMFGVHSEIAEHYHVDPERYAPHPATLDFVVAATCGWMVGTFAGALAARKIMVGYDDLVADAVGEVEADALGVLLLKRIVITYRLRIDAESRDTVERVNEVHGKGCPVSRSLEGAIAVSSTVEYLD